MSDAINEINRKRIIQIRFLTSDEQGTHEYLEAAGLALTVLHDTVGGSHPLYAVLDNSLKKNDYAVALAASRGVATLFEQGGLKSPRLTIAHEIEGDLLDIAQAQAQGAEKAKDSNQKQLQLAIAAFLTGASIEDALRRLCDSHGI